MEAAIGSAILGTIMSAAGAIQSGKAADAQAKSEATQLEARANVERVDAQQRAKEQTRQADLVSSRARAMIAGAGGDTTDVGSQEILAGIGGEGEYRSLLELYKGEEAAKSSEFAATNTRAKGKAAKRAGKFEAVGKVLEGASSMYSTYGGGFGGTTSRASDYGTRGTTVQGLPWLNK